MIQSRWWTQRTVSLCGTSMAVCDVSSGLYWWGGWTTTSPPLHVFIRALFIFLVYLFHAPLFFGDFFFSPAMFFCPSSYLDLSALMILRWGSTSTNSNGVKASHLRFSHSVFTLLYILIYCFDSCKLSHFDPSDQNAHVFFSFGRFNV